MVKLVISTLLSLISLALPAVACPSNAPDTEADFQQTRTTYILAGQSNMDGYGLQAPDTNPVEANPSSDLSSLGYAHYLPPLSGVQIYRFHAQARVGAWKYLSPNWGAEIQNEVNRFGPELAFGHQRYAATQEELRLIKYSKRNTSLATEWNPNGGAQYADLIHAVNAARRSAVLNNETLDIQSLLWMQGETDATNIFKARAYESNLENFISSVRVDLGLPHLKFYIGGIGPGGNFYQTVLDAQKAVAARDRLVFFIDGTKLSTFSNDGDGMSGATNVHYDTQSQIDLGHQFAEAMESVLLVGPAPPIAGRTFKATVENALPDEGIQIMMSSTGLAHFWNDPFGIYEGIANPALFGSQKVTTTNGTQSWKLSFPSNLAGASVWLQAWQIGHTSQVLQLQL